ncbi:MAG: glycosyltransferase family 2 protein [Vicinamibacterales bacterium]
MPNPTVSIVVFEMNEIDGMRAMLPQIKREWYDQLIVVDGGSTDGTIEWCREHGYDLFVQVERGVGAAMNEGVKRATGELVIIYAPDGSFLVDRIPMMIEKLKAGYDLVNVTRYGFGAHSDDDTFFTGMANWLFTRFVNLFFGRKFHFTDFLYTYLGFRRSLPPDVGHDTNLMTWGQLLLLRTLNHGYRIVEIPGPEPKRIGGEVKVPKIKGAYYITLAILSEFWRGASRR